jgi:ACR3 family arsenite efflux pump ArsB
VKEQPQQIMFTICLLLNFVLFIKNIDHWNKKDKRLRVLALLLIFNWVYNPIYYYKTQW